MYECMCVFACTEWDDGVRSVHDSETGNQTARQRRAYQHYTLLRVNITIHILLLLLLLLLRCTNASAHNAVVSSTRRGAYKSNDDDDNIDKR